MSRMERVWIEPMNQWMETGHVLGTSEAERNVVWWVTLVETLEEHWVSLYASKRPFRAKDILLAAKQELANTKSSVNAEAIQRQALFLKALVESESYQLHASASDLRRAKIKHLERVQLAHYVRLNQPGRR